MSPGVRGRALAAAETLGGFFLVFLVSGFFHVLVDGWCVIKGSSPAVDGVAKLQKGQSKGKSADHSEPFEHPLDPKPPCGGPAIAGVKFFVLKTFAAIFEKRFRHVASARKIKSGDVPTLSAQIPATQQFFSKPILENTLARASSGNPKMASQQTLPAGLSKCNKRFPGRKLLYYRIVFVTIKLYILIHIIII